MKYKNIASLNLYLGHPAPMDLDCAGFEIKATWESKECKDELPTCYFTLLLILNNQGEYLGSWRQRKIRDSKSVFSWLTMNFNICNFACFADNYSAV